MTHSRYILMFLSLTLAPLLLVSLVNLAVDLSYTFFDPRIRY